VKATKKFGSKNQKKSLPSAEVAIGKRFPARPARGSFKKIFVFAECPATWHSAKVSFFLSFASPVQRTI